MGSHENFAVRVSMPSMQIKTNKPDVLPRAILECKFALFSASTVQVQKESFTSVGGDKINNFLSAARRKYAHPIAHAVFFHCEQSIGLVLR